ncbi:MerR family transcriptional regulator [Tepidimonas charontis]|uniref:HTH-type transcriptional repressor CarH n=1 Tax=Tepidimonas charontis TaxID=2267262 RepID=A0A554X081_9BURK|nr:MerR family transcriptional regulator [Tepidimonas charontis]TSE29230.1 HTH-type transcriptional repressor CarH [Tepidimonas charontis]
MKALSPTSLPVAAPPSARWSIADVERETGIGKDTLRVWERRYGFPLPWRDEHGERLYDDEQLQRLRLIRRLLDAGLRPGRVVGLPLAALNAVAASSPVGAGPAAAGDELARWMDWVRRDQTAQLRAALSGALRTHGLAHTVESVIAPLCVEVGHAWLRGDIGVYQEHWFTEVVQTTLRAAIARLDKASAAAPRAPRVLLTTTPGEQHQLGLLMVECFLALEGCERVSLGVSTPLAEIVDAAQRTHADVVALSFSAQASRRDMIDAVTQLRARLAAPVELWLGGAAAQHRWRGGLPPGVVRMRQAAEVVAQVRAWRQRHARV